MIADNGGVEGRRLCWKKPDIKALKDLTFFTIIVIIILLWRVILWRCLFLGFCGVTYLQKFQETPNIIPNKYFKEEAKI